MHMQHSDRGERRARVGRNGIAFPLLGDARANRALTCNDVWDPAPPKLMVHERRNGSQAEKGR